MNSNQLSDTDVIKKISEFVRGDAIEIGGDTYIVHVVITDNNATHVSLKSLPFPDKDQIQLTVNSDAWFVNQTLHNLEI